LAKRSRRAAGADTASPRTRARTARRHQPSLLDRYRTPLITAAGVAGLLIVGVLIFGSGARTSYACDSLLAPGPVESVTPRPPTPTASPAPAETATPALSPSPEPSPGGASPSPEASPSAEPSPSPEPTPEPEPTARLGFTTTDLGNKHVDPNQELRYGYCPPASGEHFNVGGLGPIRSAVYQPTGEQSPGGWVHNLEHGYVVLLYRCPSGTPGQGECISAADYQLLQDFYAQVPDSGIAGCPNKTVVARFDSMTTPFALLAWDRALLLDKMDIDTALTFTEQWRDHVSTPERGAC
jgi:hypothetical protein